MNIAEEAFIYRQIKYLFSSYVDNSSIYVATQKHLKKKQDFHALITVAQYSEEIF